MIDLLLDNAREDWRWWIPYGCMAAAWVIVEFGVLYEFVWLRRNRK